MPAELNEVAIGPYEPGDEHAILAAFKKVFDVGRPLDVWRWQYALNPAGLHCFLAKLPDGRVISQFTGVPRRVKVGGEVLCFSEIVDSLTDPEFRRGLKKPGLFATTCYRFVDRYGRRDGEVVMYGLPNPPAFRVGSALLGYAYLYEVEFCSKEVEEAAAAGAEELAVAAVERFGPDADALYERVARESDIMTVRDALYLNWRYAARPDLRYELLEMRDASGALVAAAALHHGWRRLPVTVAAEWLVPPRHPAAPASLRALERAAARAGSHHLKLLVRPHGAAWDALRDAGFRPEPTQFRLVGRTYDKDGLPLERLKDGWELSAGDFDIV